MLTQWHCCSQFKLDTTIQSETLWSRSNNGPNNATYAQRKITFSALMHGWLWSFIICFVKPLFQIYSSKTKKYKLTLQTNSNKTSIIWIYFLNTREHLKDNWIQTTENKKVQTKTTTTLLLYGFFHFYPKIFPWSTVMVSIKRAQNDGTANWTPKTCFWKLSSFYFCIEDSFETYDSHMPQN